MDGEIRIERGELDDAQIVALVTSLAVSRSPEPTDPPPGAPASDEQISMWSRRSRLIRPSVRPGPGAWRASMMPR